VAQQFCTVCGQKIPGSRFCANCGNPAKAEVPTVPMRSLGLPWFLRVVVALFLLLQIAWWIQMLVGVLHLWNTPSIQAQVNSISLRFRRRARAAIRQSLTKFAPWPRHPEVTVCTPRISLALPVSPESPPGKSLRTSKHS
jgi:hypothetical protein